VKLTGEKTITLSASLSNLPENKSSYVSGLPVGGVKKVRQSHRWECGQHIRAVQSIVQPLGAPPSTGN